jgi:hypothetical protein
MDQRACKKTLCQKKGKNKIGKKKKKKKKTEVLQ